MPGCGFVHDTSYCWEAECDFGSQGVEGLEVTAYGARANGISTGVVHLPAAEPGEKRSCQQDRSTEPLDQTFVRDPLGHVFGIDLESAVIRKLYGCSDASKQVGHDVDVGDGRDVFDYTVSVGDQRGGHHGKDGVLVGGDFDRAV